jgi:hypothetical protein
VPVPSIPLRRLLPLFVAACAALLLLPVVADAKRSSLKIGFAEHSYAAADPTAFWADVADLRVQTLRWDIAWDRTAPNRPTRPCVHTDPAYDWAETDVFVRGAQSAGLVNMVMFTVWRTPQWASSVKRSTGRVQEMPKVKEWRCFVRAAATRYNGKYTPPGASAPLPRIRAWEAWNEPNGIFAFMPQRAGGKNVSMRNYVALLNTLHREVKRFNGRNATVVGGALYKQSSRQGVNPITFMRGMKRYKARFDVLSIHPYNNVPRLGLRDGRNQSRTRPRTITVGNIDTFITLANQVFGKRYPIWITEWGWQTRGTGYDDKQYSVTNRQQATFMKQSIAKISRYPQIQRAMWFLMRDDPPCTRPCQTPWTSGVRTWDDVKKPSYNAWKQARKRLR